MALPRIMIVEDQTLVAMDMENMLIDAGYDVAASVTTGEEALAKTAQLNPDLVLMDISLGGRLDGIQTAEEILHKFNIPVIYVTAHSEQDTLERAKVTEPYSYLLKPISVKDLKSNIEISLYRHTVELEKLKLIQDLNVALENVKTLSGIIPICASCNKVRVKQTVWQRLSTFIHENTDARLSHTICPECFTKLYPEFADKMKPE